jgi:hypothetical protein
LKFTPLLFSELRQKPVSEFEILFLRNIIFYIEEPFNFILSQNPNVELVNFNKIILLSLTLSKKTKNDMIV